MAKPVIQSKSVETSAPIVANPPANPFAGMTAEQFALFMQSDAGKQLVNMLPKEVLQTTLQNVESKEETARKGRVARLTEAANALATELAIGVKQLVIELAFCFSLVVSIPEEKGEAKKRGKAMSPAALVEQVRVLRFLSIQMARKAKGLDYVDTVGKIRDGIKGDKIDSTRIHQTKTKLDSGKLSLFPVVDMTEHKTAEGKILSVSYVVRDASGATVTESGELIPADTKQDSSKVA
jgi:hypothetical protein